MRLKTWPVLAVGFGTVLLLTLLFGLDSWRRARQIFAMVVETQQTHARAERALLEIESGVYLSGIFVRDFLLDPSHLTAGFQRQQLLELRTAMENHLKTLQDPSVSEDQKVFESLRREIDSYWGSLDPVFDWTPRQKLALSTGFLRRVILPRRDAVLGIAAEARALNKADLAKREKEMDARMAEFRRSGKQSLAVVLGLGILASVMSFRRVSTLESRSREQHEQTERAEQEMRRLSRQLVHMQEDERRSLSRELHDEVGQTLTALGVELGNLQRVRGVENDFQAHLEDAKQLTAQTLQCVRSIAAGLRPSVLDDLGLGPALDWQAREFSRRTGIPVEVVLEGLRDELPEAHRTCVYRVVQEALTNCARHAAATRIRVALHTEAGRLSLIVQDDGRGMPRDYQRERASGTPSMGLVGMEDRVREIGGTLTVVSQPGGGTLVKVSIPLPQEVPA